jgi:hypothetical protein
MATLRKVPPRSVRTSTPPLDLSTEPLEDKPNALICRGESPTLQLLSDAEAETGLLTLFRKDFAARSEEDSFQPADPGGRSH